MTDTAIDWIGSFFAHLPRPTALVNAGLRVLTINPAMARLSGVAPAAAVGRRLAELLPMLAERLGVTLTIALESAQTFADIAVDADARRFAVSCFPMAGAFCVTVDEVGPATATTSRPDERDALFHAVFDDAAVPMVAFDWRGGARHNQAFRALLGYEDDELVRLGVRGITHPDDYDRDAAAFQRLMAGEIDHYQIEKRYLRKGGATIWGRLFVSIARDEQRKPLVIIAMIEDITDRRRFAEERERAIQALEEAVRAREIFLSIASHELRTPLTPLKLNLQMLRRKLGDGAALAELDGAIRQVERLRLLVDKLLDVSRIATGTLRPVGERVELSELVGEVVARFAAEAQQAGSTVTLTTAPTPLVALADRLQLEQVISNLLANAIKFGRGAPIEVTSERRDERLRLSVRDHGIGIAPADQERIFGRFERGASQIHYGGLGLGLYIAREIVAAHGGRIGVDSRPTEGATFFVELPPATP